MLLHWLKAVAVANNGISAQEVINGIDIAQHIIECFISNAFLSLLLFVPVPISTGDFFGYWDEGSV
nr:hypothetical protein [Endozoicomonas ascidiicola]